MPDHEPADGGVYQAHPPQLTPAPPDAAEQVRGHDEAERIHEREFAEFYRRDVPRLVAFLQMLGASLYDAADIAQESMIRAHANWLTINHPHAWIRSVARRELARRRKARSQEDLVHDVDQVREGTMLMPTHNIDEWEQRQQLLTAMRDLPERQRQVLAYTIEGYRPQEIADELRISEDAARANLYKARRALLTRLRSQDSGTNP